MTLQVLHRIENAALRTFTLIVGEPGDEHASMYHYAADPPANVSAEDWERQTREHAIALEQTARGATLEQPVALGPASPAVAEQPPTEDE
jgi:hypothetical protein